MGIAWKIKVEDFLAFIGIDHEGKSFTQIRQSKNLRVSLKCVAQKNKPNNLFTYLDSRAGGESRIMQEIRFLTPYS